MMKTYDLTGQTFGKLTVLEKDIEKSKQLQKSYWFCKCSCGNPKIKSIYGNHLKTGATQSCGCSRIKDLTGQIFGHLEPVKIDWERTGKNNSAFWLCKCHKCNSPILKSVSSQNLINGHSTTCGCISNFSKGEDKIREILTSLDINFKEQQSFLDCRGKNNAPLKFDFYFKMNNKDYLIEYQGIQHFQVINGWGGEQGFIERQRRDKQKREYCKNHNYILIEISYKDFKKLNQEFLLQLININI